MKARVILLLSLLCLASGLGWQSTSAQPEGEKFFEQTGHHVSGDFFRFYFSVPNPAELYGYPISVVFRDATTQLIVQYFEKVRFELHPENPISSRVVVSKLGEYMYSPGAASPVPKSYAACRTIHPTDFRVCYDFLNFFKANGGVKQFGLPISNFELHGDRIVQYFERARFEWHPELPFGKRVVLTDLGRQYFHLRGENPTYLIPEQDERALTSVISLRVRAYPKYAVTGTQGRQTVYIVVQNQAKSLLPNATVSLVVRWPSGKEQHFDQLEPTDDKGITRHTLFFEAEELGLVEITATASFAGAQQSTLTSFRIWH